MPELPEVETICRRLREGDLSTPPLIGMEITGAALYWQKTLEHPEAANFFSQIQGRTIDQITRRGKYFILTLDKGHLLGHLRMSGDLIVERQDEPLDAYCRFCLYLQEGWRLSFNDMRKFGRIWYVDDPQIVLSSLGPEPFDADLDAKNFFERLQSRRRQLKPLLMDQNFLAGVGNIYADEALHLAGLHPLTIANQIGFVQAEALLSAIRKVLEAGIRHNGSSIDWIYRGGDFQNYFYVYGREGEPCKTCGHLIERIVVAQRSSHFCPFCQPMEANDGNQS